jgi:hypothetical protein
MKTHNTKPSEPEPKNNGRTKHHLNADRKPRSDSPLHRLTPERQQALMDFLDTHSLREGVEQLAA